MLGCVWLGNSITWSALKPLDGNRSITAALNCAGKAGTATVRHPVLVVAGAS
jgi:hypothetical protein